MTVKETEFTENTGKYLDLIAREDIFITRDGETIAKMVNPNISAADFPRGLLKDAPNDIDRDSIRGGAPGKT